MTSAASAAAFDIPDMHSAVLVVEFHRAIEVVDIVPDDYPVLGKACHAYD